MLPVHHAILSGSAIPPYDPSIYRQVADRCDIPTSSGGAVASPGKTVRTRHVYYGRKPTTTLKVAFANFFLNAGVTGETLGAADSTIQCAIEVNGSPGTYTDFTFGGLTTVTPGAANHVISDATAIGFTLKPGDTFFIRTLDISPTSSIFSENVRGSAAGVQDEWVLAGNFLHGGEGTGAHGTGGGRWPSAILAPSGYAAWLIIGDSKCWGQNEAKEGDGTLGHRGWASKWISDRLGYGHIRMGKTGDKAVNVAGVNGRPKCFALATACGITHGLVAPLGVNDLTNSQTRAQTIASLKNIATRLRSAGLVKLVTATIEPTVSQIVVNSDWTPANQQPNTSGTFAGLAAWAGANDDIRAFTLANSGYDMTLDPADLVDTGHNAGFWSDQLAGVGGASTNDGFHAAVTTNGNISPWTYVANNLPRRMP